MKKFNPLHILLPIFFLVVSCGQKTKENRKEPDFHNFYGIVWNETASQNLAYAKQMGYDYVFYQNGMENDSLSNDLYFYVETPEYSVYPKYLDTLRQYSARETKFYETNCVLKGNKASFPENIATGWYLNDHTFTAQLDFQQQKVITWAIDSILKIVESIEARNPRFHFGGFAWNNPQPSGDFWTAVKPYGQEVTLSYWNGGDYGIKSDEVVHNFATYGEGRLNYYKQLIHAARKKYPDIRILMEPESIYDDWICQVRKCDFLAEIAPDLLSQERYGTEFVDDERIVQSGLIAKENICSTTSDRFGEADNRLIAAKAAINGAWFSWYGRFGGMGDMPYFRSITDVPSRLKLIRMVPNWENLNGTPLEERKWNGTNYQSPTAYVSPDAIAAVQPHTGKMFIAFVTEKGKIALPKGKKIAAIYKADGLFRELEDGSDEVNIRSKTLTPKTGNNLNVGYIIHFK